MKTKSGICIHAVTSLLICCSCSVCHGEHLFVGIMETESYQSLELSVSAFANVTRSPELNDLIKTEASRLTGLPVMAGFEKNKRIRIIQTIDPEQPLSDINPVHVAIIPIMDGGKEIERILDATYMNRSYWRSNISVYDKPVSTNHFEMIAIAKEGRFLLTSRSKDALLWTSENKKLLNAQPLIQKGTLRFLINPQKTAAILNAKGNLALLQLFKPVEILQELEICSFAITMEAQSLTITAEASPLEGTPLETLAKSIQKPDEALLNSTSSESFLTSLSRCDEPDVWNRFTLNLPNYVVPSLTELNTKELFTGEKVQYLAPSKDKKGVVFVQIEPLNNAAAVQSAITSLDKTVSDDAAISLEKITPEKGTETTGLCYKMHLRTSDEKNTSAAIYAVAALFIENAYLELEIKDNQLITVMGPRNSIRDVISRMPGSPRNISLLKEITIRNESLNPDLVSGTKLELTRLLRFAASIIPGITREQLAILPEGGYGLTLGLIKEDDTAIRGSFQISADELSALKNIGADGRKLMQKLLMSMLSKRIEQMDLPREKENQ